MSSEAKELPAELKTGDIVEVQISPFGEYPQTTDDGNTIVQIVDEAAADSIVANAEISGEEYLVDGDHASMREDGSTQAFGWLKNIRKGVNEILADLKVTDIGAEAIGSRRFRFLSPVWDVAADGHPIRLKSVALTNTPNLPVRPLINSVRKDETELPEAGTEAAPVEPKTIENNPNMEELKTLLGLAPEAADEEILAAVTALKEAKEAGEKKLAEIEAERAAAAEAEAEKEAEQFANECGCRDEDKEAVKNSYRKDKELTIRLMNMTRKPAAAEAEVKHIEVSNARKEAKSPRDEYLALKTPEARAEYFAKHAKELV